MAVKVTKSERKERDTLSVRTKDKADVGTEPFMWWKANSKRELAEQLLDTAGYLKTNQNYRQRQASIHARMYGNIPLSNFVGQKLNTMNSTSLPVDRPTMNIVQSCVDTLTSRLTQSKPKPTFLTDNANYKQRNLAEQLNQFVEGEFHQTKAYDVGETIFRDACILGTGAIKIYRDDEDKVALDRVLVTELLVDLNDAFNGKPRTLYHTKLIDRAVLKELFPEDKSTISKAEQAYPDNSGDSQKTVSDQVMVVEAWHLPSSSKATDGRHVIATTAGVILDEQYDKPTFPFVFFHYSPRLVGFWAQGLSEQLAGTQIEINKLLVTISRSINLVGVPRIFVEAGSKVVSAHFTNEIGAIIKYSGVKPDYEVAPCVPAELYQQLQRLIDYGYQQCGISQLSSQGQKPQGLDSGEAIRSYDDLQSDRFATLSKNYQEFYKNLAYQCLDVACDVAAETGKYQTVYPDKDGTREINLPDVQILLDDPFLIQCYDESSLPRDPAGRRQEVVEMMQSGLITPQEGRRLLNFPDLKQQEKLANAPEERILKMLDGIIEKGESGYEPPDPFTDLALGEQLVTQYYNLYVAAGLEESKAQLLRDWHQQLLALKAATMPPPPMPGAGQPQAAPEAPPTNPMIPNVPQ